MFALFMGVGYLIGGESGMFIAFFIALLMNGISFFYSDKIALSMFRAKEVSESEAPQLHRIVEELATEAGIPKPRVYISNIEVPNAFATGRSPKHSAVAVTKGLLEILDQNEIKGVLAHEIAHIANRDILISSLAAVIASAIAMLARVAYFANIFGGDNKGGGIGNLLATLIMIIITPILAMIIQLAISRTREYVADEKGAKLARNPLYLANALRKMDAYAKMKPVTENEINPAATHMLIINPFKKGGLAALLSTHPPIEKRIEKLEAMAY
jgi:heat shock protein HtpX